MVPWNSAGKALWDSGTPTYLIPVFSVLLCAGVVNIKEPLESSEAQFARLWALRPDVVITANTT